MHFSHPSDQNNEVVLIKYSFVLSSKVVEATSISSTTADHTLPNVKSLQSRYETPAMHHQTASGYELLQYALFALQWRKQDDHQNYQNSAAQRSSVVIADENQCNHEYHQKIGHTDEKQANNGWTNTRGPIDPSDDSDLTGNVCWCLIVAVPVADLSAFVLTARLVVASCVHTAAFLLTKRPVDRAADHARWGLNNKVWKVGGSGFCWQ